MGLIPHVRRLSTQNHHSRFSRGRIGKLKFWLRSVLKEGPASLRRRRASSQVGLLIFSQCLATRRLNSRPACKLEAPLGQRLDELRRGAAPGGATMVRPYGFVWLFCARVWLATPVSNDRHSIRTFNTNSSLGRPPQGFFCALAGGRASSLIPAARSVA